MRLEGTASEANLREAFAREAQTHRRLHYFARRADIEGHAEVAGMLRQIAEGETGHAFGHLEFLEEVGDPLSGEPLGDTRTNLRAALAAETADADDHYARWAETARSERLGELADWFEACAAAERAHAALLRRLLEDVEGE
ncbi:MAG: rubrerythrin family protein [Candidatus Dormibacteria bacterium]